MNGMVPMKSAQATTLRIDSLQWPVTVLGYGARIGIWFQGCSIGCPGCCAKHTWNADEGKVDILCYSGFPWKHLSRRHGDILRHLDAVIAEPYVESLAPQWLRGSGNQTIHLLSDLGRRRYAKASGQTNGLQVVAAGDDIRIIGIPNRGDLERMQEKLAGLGVAFGEQSW